MGTKTITITHGAEFQLCGQPEEEASREIIFE